MAFKPSVYQQAVFDFITVGRGSAIVEAVAGSGKTTTIVEALKLIPTSQSILFLAFNKSIAEELSKRIPKHAKARTTHSLGMSAVMRHGKVRVDGEKMKAVLGALRAETPILHSNDLWKVAKTKILKLASLAKNHGLAPESSGLDSLMPDTLDSWNHLMDHFDVIGDGELQAELLRAQENEPERAFLIGMARKALTMSLADSDTIDFDDMIYLPVVRGLTFEKYDWLFIDEAQDISSIQLAMLKSALKPGSGRLVAVGDPRQAIYGFRGADAEALANISRVFDAVRLPLSISYRCPRAVVREAQNYVSHIEPSEAAPEGEVVQLDRMKVQDFKAGDLVLCRFKAPIVKLAYRLISNQIPAAIIGRDIGAGIISLIEKLRAKTLDDLPGKLSDWHQNALVKKLRSDPDADTSELDEKREMIQTMIDYTRATTVGALCREIEALFSDGGSGAVKLSTIHKAKGLEAARVFWLDPEYSIKKIKQEWQLVQEDNLRYVAVTRSKNYLGFVALENIGA